MMYSRAVINWADTDYVSRKDRKKEIKQEKSETLEVPLSSQSFISYWLIEVKPHKVKLQPAGVIIRNQTQKSVWIHISRN